MKNNIITNKFLIIIFTILSISLNNLTAMEREDIPVSLEWAKNYHEVMSSLEKQIEEQKDNEEIKIELSDSQIDDLLFSEIIKNIKDLNITYLDLSGNQIKDISPIANLTNLEDLYLSYNQIEDISSIANLSNIKRLRLSNNQIREIPPEIQTLLEKNNVVFYFNHQYLEEIIIKKF